MNDHELQNMMLEIQQHRKRERDFTSLEDQIRCLKNRFYNLDNTEVITYIDLLIYLQKNDEDQLKQQLIDQSLEIDNLREDLQELRGQIKTSKNDNSSLQTKNVQLYHIEGERNAELAMLRGNTSKQLASNQEFEAEIERMKQANERLKDESEELQNQRSKIERQAGDHRQKASQTQAMLKEFEQKIND